MLEGISNWQGHSDAVAAFFLTIHHPVYPAADVSYVQFCLTTHSAFEDILFAFSPIQPQASCPSFS